MPPSWAPMAGDPLQLGAVDRGLGGQTQARPEVSHAPSQPLAWLTCAPLQETSPGPRSGEVPLLWAPSAWRPLSTPLHCTELGL